MIWEDLGRRKPVCKCLKDVEMMPHVWAQLSQPALSGTHKGLTTELSLLEASQGFRSIQTRTQGLECPKEETEARRGARRDGPGVPELRPPRPVLPACPAAPHTFLRLFVLSPDQTQRCTGVIRLSVPAASHTGVSPYFF